MPRSRGICSCREFDSAWRNLQVRLTRRKKYLVDKGLQLRFVWMNLSYAALLLIAMAVSLFAPLIFQMNNLDARSAEASDAAVSLLYLHDRFWLPVVLTLILVTAHSLKTTHRVAGPLFRFRSVFASIEAGILPKPVKLRKNDYLDTELNAINRMLESLRLQVSEITRLAERLHESAARYGDSVDHSRTIQATDELWNDIVKTEDQLLKVLSRFRVEI
jgi:methyl-accepting chemotaxis protein